MDDKMARLSMDTVQSLTIKIMELEAKLGDYENALKEYAESDNWDLKTLQIENVKYGWRPALETLKKWEDKDE